MRNPLPGILAALLLLPVLSSSQEAGPAERLISLDEFLRTSLSRDTQFEAVLVQELAVRRQMDLRLPARDLVLSVREELSMASDEDDVDDQTSVSLSKLFPMTGTELGASYSITPPSGTGDADSKLAFTLAQPIAENAFGRSTRLLKKIVGVENEVARHQIAEAYEDYLAAVHLAFLDWYGSYESLKVGRSSYIENLKLLDNMEDRKKSRIAKDVDVNKVKLQVLAKKERLLALEEDYQKALNLAKRMLRYEGEEALVPAAPPARALPEGDFKQRYARFADTSRTCGILRLLEKKSSLDVDREADGLLPSIELLLAFSHEGKKAALQRSDSQVLGGVSLEFPFRDQRGRAQHAVARVEERKARLRSVNTRHRLRTDLADLDIQMYRERELKKLAAEKIALARSILGDESENYTYGKVSLNDYISAVNLLDTNRFNQIEREVQERKLIIEWLRLTDTLAISETVTQQFDSLTD